MMFEIVVLLMMNVVIVEVTVLLVLLLLNYFSQNMQKVQVVTNILKFLTLHLML